MRISIKLLIILFWIFPAVAFAANVPLPDQKQEERAQTLFTEFRCMVCQGQNIADSNAEVAADMRASIRQQIVSGLSDEKIKAEMAARYGDAILMKPPFKAGTLFLWLGPWLILLAGGIGAFFYFRGAGQKKL